jgi:quercetin dioxygenase-like cupin family protein
MRNIEYSNVQKISQMISYQDGTIVSKTLINKTNGTVTLFAFDKDQTLSEHTAPFDALLYVIEGEAEVKISGKYTNLKTNEMILMPANVAHAVKAIKEFKMLLIMIKS